MIVYVHTSRIAAATQWLLDHNGYPEDDREMAAQQLEKLNSFDDIFGKTGFKVPFNLHNMVGLDDNQRMVFKLTFAT